MPATLVEKDIVTTALRRQWATLRDLAASLDDAQWEHDSVLPGWRNADIVAHIIGTECMLDGREATTPADLAQRGHVRNPIGELNESWVEHFRGRPRAEVLAAFDEIIGVRTAALERMTDDEFAAETMTPAGPDTYGRFMRIRVFDCWIHEVDLRDGVDAGRPSDELPAGWALDEIAASLPFVIGKRAGAPDGATVLIDLTGLAPRQIRIAVNGRAQLVESFTGGDEAATVRLSLDEVTLARLIGARPAADPAAVAIDGDRELGETIVARLNYLI